MAKDSAFIPTLKDGDFPLRPSQSYKLNIMQLDWGPNASLRPPGFGLVDCPPLQESRSDIPVSRFDASGYHRQAPGIYPIRHDEPWKDLRSHFAFLACPGCISILYPGYQTCITGRRSADSPVTGFHVGLSGDFALASPWVLSTRRLHRLRKLRANASPGPEKIQAFWCRNAWGWPISFTSHLRAIE